MASLKPFRAVRPVWAMAQNVAALPYDVMNSEEARVMAGGNLFSFLHVDRAEIDLPADIDPYDQRVYEKARDNLAAMKRDGILVKDAAECLYIYRQTMDGRSQTGIVGCASVDDYLNDVIRKHENTRADKEEDRIRHVDACDANTGPIFLTYRSKARINAVVDAWTSGRSPVYDFVSEDGIGHTVWVIDDGSVIAGLKKAFGSIDRLYIADGHHRAASAVKVGLKRRGQIPDHTGAEEFNYFLAVLFPDDQLKILDYNRLVRDLNGLSREAFMSSVGRAFDVSEITSGEPYRPQRRHEFGMYLEGKWYRLTAKSGSFSASDPVARLDVSILHDNLLGPVLGIRDPRTDKRIDFVGGIRGLKELERRAGLDMKVAFAMFPTSVSELMEIADSGSIMPPKSTWFEPKLRSGLFIHELK